MSIRTSLFSHSYVVNEWLNRHCNVQIDIGIRADELGTNSDVYSYIAMQCLFSHSFTTYEWLKRDCDVQINIGFEQMNWVYIVYSIQGEHSNFERYVPIKKLFLWSHDFEFFLF
jgi:hypothetical protein